MQQSGVKLFKGRLFSERGDYSTYSVGIVDIAFQSAGTGKSATPTEHLDIHFAPFAVSYELFPR